MLCSSWYTKWEYPTTIWLYLFLKSISILTIWFFVRRNKNKVILIIPHSAIIYSDDDNCDEYNDDDNDDNYNDDKTHFPMLVYTIYVIPLTFIYKEKPSSTLNVTHFVMLYFLKCVNYWEEEKERKKL